MNEEEVSAEPAAPEDFLHRTETDGEDNAEVSPEDMEVFSGIMADLNREMEKYRAGSAVPQKGSFRQRKSAPAKSRGPEPDEKLASLREKLEKSESNNDKLRRKNGELSNELAKVRSKADALAAYAENLASENAALRKKISSSPKSMEAAETRIAALSAENSDLQRETIRLRSVISVMEKEKDALDAEIKKLRSDTEKLKAGIPAAEIAGRIDRISGAEFRSDLFRGPRYEVKIAKDGSYMTFKADIEGAVICKRETISLPDLPDLIGFQGPKSYDAYQYGGKLKIMLRRGDIYGVRERKKQPLQKDTHQEFPQFRMGRRRYDPEPQHRPQQAGRNRICRGPQQLREDQCSGCDMQIARPGVRPGRHP